MSKMITRTVTVTRATVTVIRGDGHQEQFNITYAGKPDVKTALKEAKKLCTLEKNDQILVGDLTQQNSRYAMSMDVFMNYADLIENFDEAEESEEE